MAGLPFLIAVMPMSVPARRIGGELPIAAEPAVFSQGRGEGRLDRLEQRVRLAISQGVALLDTAGRPIMAAWAPLCAGFRPQDLLIELPGVVRALAQQGQGLPNHFAQDALAAERLAVLVSSGVKALEDSVGSGPAELLSRRLAQLEAENARLREAMAHLSDAALAVEAARSIAVERVESIRTALADVLASASLAEELRRMIWAETLPTLAPPLMDGQAPWSPMPAEPLFDAAINARRA